MMPAARSFKSRADCGQKHDPARGCAEKGLTFQRPLQKGGLQPANSSFNTRQSPLAELRGAPGQGEAEIRFGDRLVERTSVKVAHAGR